MLRPFGHKVRIGMKWFRSKVKYGARVALFALAVQLALSFGHFHAIAAQAAPIAYNPLNSYRAPAPDSDQHPDDFCAICAVDGDGQCGVVCSATGVAVAAGRRTSRTVATDAEFVHRRIRSRRLSAARSSPLLKSIDVILSEGLAVRSRPIRWIELKSVRRTSTAGAFAIRAMRRIRSRLVGIRTMPVV